MLKLGCMSLSYKDEFAAGTLDLDGFIDRAHGLRLDGIDLHTRAFASEDPAYLRGIRMHALKKGITLSYIGVSSNFGVPAGDKLDEQVTTARHWIDVAHFMGIPMVRVFAAWVPEGDTEEAVYERMMPCLKEVAAYGQEKGIVLGLHNHNHGCVTRTGKDVRRIIDASLTLKPMAGADVSALPGTLEWRREAEWTTAGIPITDDHRDLLETIAMELALDLPPWIEA